MRKTRVSIVLVVSFLVVILTVSATPDSAVLGTWRDINPTAYISPPANPPLNSVYMLSATEGWAVGHYLPSSDTTQAFPAVLHYDGSTWNLVPVPKNPTDTNIAAGYALTSVNFGPPNNPISRNDGWAVGFGFDIGAACGGPSTCGLALHWDGVTWREQLAGLAGPNAGPLQSVFMVSPTDVWAVGADQAGANGVFWHWNGVPGLGGGWAFQGLAPGTPLQSVFMVGSADGWAVGASGAIYHYFGGAWVVVPSPVPGGLNSVFMISATDGWAVGTGGTIIHYTSGTWAGPVSPGTTINALLSVFMVSSTEGWAVGTFGTIVHYSGGTWTALPINHVPTLPATAFSFNSVYYNTASDGWAVGDNGVILHFDGSNWGTVTSPSMTELTSISFGPPLSASFNQNDGWAVGRSTSLFFPPTVEPTIIHWNGFMWTKGVAIGTTNDLFSVFMVSGGDVWTVGGGTDPTSTCPIALIPCPVILHFMGGSWNTITPPSGSYVLNSVFMVSPNEGWAVGCQPSFPGFTTQCLAVPRIPGAAGIILHYAVTGGVGTWAIFPTPAVPALNSVFMLGPNEGWAVGDTGTVLHYTVTGGVGTWNVVTVSPAAGNLNSVFMLSRTSGWAVGGFPPPGPPSGPVIIYWDGTHWTQISTPTIPGGIPPPIPLAEPVLTSIYCTGNNDCWAVGDADLVANQFAATIFHWDGIAWTHITLAPSLLGLPAFPPRLNSVFMLSPSTGWIVGAPPFLPFLPPPFPTTLSTILQFAPFGGLLTATSTATRVSTVTVTTSTSFLTSSVVSTFTSITSTTRTTTTTSSVSGVGVPGFPIESIIAGIGIGLAALILLRRRRVSVAAG